MASISRRDFLAGAAGAAGVVGLGALGLGACSSSGSSGGGPAGGATTASAVTSAAADGRDAPFDTVIVVMMENRSFDTMLGWLPGADGAQAGLSYVDAAGTSHPTWHLAPDWQGCAYQDPMHFWQAVAQQFNGGKVDGFLATQPVGDQFPIGYYEEADLPIMAALARGYTTLDHYFCSMLGPTWPNRLYQLCGTTDLVATGVFPAPGDPRPCQLQTAIFDRTRAAGLSAGYYSPGEPMTGLFASGRYDDITFPYERFLADAAAGSIPNVAFVDPNYTGVAEFLGTSNDDHPYGSVHAGEAFLAEVHEAVRQSPQWERTVLVISFDEHGGFYDHVVPPTVADDTVLAGEGPFPDLTRLGFRVPAIVVSPFAPQKVETAGPYEHCSVLRMIEWRWGLEPMTRRDASAKNLADALDLSTARAPITLPAFTPEPAQVCSNTAHFG